MTEPICIPVTDVGASYGGTGTGQWDAYNLVLTLPGYMDRKEIERHLRSMSKARGPYEYRCHAWRNAHVEPQQRDI